MKYLDDNNFQKEENVQNIHKALCPRRVERIHAFYYDDDDMVCVRKLFILICEKKSFIIDKYGSYSIACLLNYFNWRDRWKK